MSLTVVSVSFFTAVTMFLSSTADVFLDLPVRGVLLSTPLVSFFLRRFQMVVLVFPVFVQWFVCFYISQLHNCSFFTHRHLSGFHVGYTSNLL